MNAVSGSSFTLIKSLNYLDKIASFTIKAKFFKVFNNITLKKVYKNSYLLKNSWNDLACCYVGT